MLERLLHRYRAVVLVVVIPRRPVGGKTPFVDEARVADERGRRDVPARQTRLERSEIDERLEQRSDQPLRIERAIELIDVVIAAADERADFAAWNVDVNQYALQFRLWIAAAQAAIAALDSLQSRFENARGAVLRGEIDRRVNLQAATFHILDPVVVRHFLQHAVDIERNRTEAGALAKRLARQRRGQRFLIRPLIDLLLLQHQAEHRRATLRGEIGPDERRVVVRTADQSRQQRGFRHVDFRHRLAEIEARCFADTENGDRAVAAEVDVVEIGLEDLALRIFRVEDDGHECFKNFTAQSSFTRQVVILDKLLRESGSPFGHAVMRHVAKERAHDAERIDSGVMPETNVFGGNDGVLQRLRHLLEFYGAPIFELLAEDRRQQLRLERGVVDVDRRDRAAAKRDVHALRVVMARRVRELARVDVDRIAAADVLARLLERFHRSIAEAIELLEDVIGLECVAGLERRVVGEDARRQ